MVLIKLAGFLWLCNCLLVVRVYHSRLPGPIVSVLLSTCKDDGRPQESVWCVIEVISKYLNLEVSTPVTACLHWLLFACSCDYHKYTLWSLRWRGPPRVLTLIVEFPRQQRCCSGVSVPLPKNHFPHFWRHKAGILPLVSQGVIEVWNINNSLATFAPSGMTQADHCE